MSFVDLIQVYYDKLPNMTVVTNMWKEIIRGQRSNVSSDHVIEYSFHYPVDTELYLVELNQKFDDSMKEDLRKIDGNLKAYIQTFLYYCMGSKDRMPIRTSLMAAELYLKILLLPSDLGKLYYERNIYIMVLQYLNNCTKKKNIPVQQVLAILELTYNYILEHEVSCVVLQGTVNMYANIVKHRVAAGDIKECDDPLVVYCLKYLKELIRAKQQPRDVKFIMESMLRYLRSDTSKDLPQAQRKLAINVSKKFIKGVMLGDVENENKTQYFLDSLFAIFGVQHFDYVDECVEIINMLDEQLYKELLRRIPNYLESKNHERYYINLMQIIYYMLKDPHPLNFSKLDVLFSVCFKDILVHMLSKKRQIQYKTIEILAKICLLKQNAIVDRIFEQVNETGKFVTLETNSILRVMIRILRDQYAGNQVRSKNILYIISKMLVALNKVDGNLSSQVLYLICKDGTPFSIKHILPNLHELFLLLSEKTYCDARVAIMRIFFKMAMHSDASSSVFLEHLYQSVIYPSTVGLVKYGPEQYSNMLFSEEFDYKLFLAKCRHLIKYDHVYYTISNFNFKATGYPVLLNCLLDYIKYTEYNILTDVIIQYFDDVKLKTEEFIKQDYLPENYNLNTVVLKKKNSFYFVNAQKNGHENSTDLNADKLERSLPNVISCVDTSGHLLTGYKRILFNKGVYQIADLPKFKVIHGLLWDSLFKQTCGLTNIKASFVLIDTLKEILQLPGDEEQRDNLMTLATESAYRALMQHQFHQGSVMHLTELCITLRRPPREQILVIFENVMDDPRTLTLLKTRYKATLIQLISFFGTIAMMNRPKIPTATKLFMLALDIPDPLVKLTAIKIYYNLATEISHEFDGIIKFCFKNVTSRHTVLSRVCVLILEELIHDNYVLLNSEDFMRFVHRLASYSLSDFMKHLLEERFLVSNKHDIGRFYMTTLIYMSGHTKLDNYPVAQTFREDIDIMRTLVDCPNDLIRFLFTSIQIKTRFNILREMCSIFDSLVAGKCKVDDNFFTYFHYSLYTFKVMSCKPLFNYKDTYYGQVCRSIEKQIFNKDIKFKDPAFYGEYEVDVRKCTVSLLELLFFIQEEERLKDYLFPVFDTVACWVDHVKPELIYYVQYEKGTDFDHSLRKLVRFYKSNKQRLENFVNNQERLQKKTDKIQEFA